VRFFFPFEERSFVSIRRSISTAPEDIRKTNRVLAEKIELHEEDEHSGNRENRADSPRIAKNYLTFLMMERKGSGLASSNKLRFKLSHTYIWIWFPKSKTKKTMKICNSIN
jgi:hypothetical protein